MAKFINSDTCYQLLAGEKITLLDGGARGELFEPFHAVKADRLQVLRLEPDADAPISRVGNQIMLNKAIWNQLASIDLHVAKEPSVSSVYPPDMQFADRFIPAIGSEARQTIKKVQIEAAAIDQLCEENQLPYPDFIKLDIHGCETEALEGAKKALENKCLALFIESWLIEAHTGQKLTYAVDQLLHAYGFYPHDIWIGRWPFKGSENWNSAGQSVLNESLYFKDVLHTKSKLERIQYVKLIAIADLYGHSLYARMLVDEAEAQAQLTSDEARNLVQFLQENNRIGAFKKLKTKIIRKVIRGLEKMIS